MQRENEIWHLIARKFAGEATTEELAILQKEFAANPGIEEAVAIISRLWPSRQDAATSRLYAAYAKHLSELIQKT